MSVKNQPAYQGQCLCGAIKYQVDAIEPKMGHCHCNMCRKFHGSAFATLGEAKSENFQWLAGDSLLKSFVAKNGTTRQFCSNCGSSMTFADANADGSIVEFALGTLDSEIVERPDVHIYADYKANWFDINDDLPKYKEGRDSGPFENK